MRIFFEFDVVSRCGGVRPHPPHNMGHDGAGVQYGCTGVEGVTEDGRTLVIDVRRRPPARAAGWYEFR